MLGCTREGTPLNQGLYLEENMLSVGQSSIWASKMNLFNGLLETHEAHSISLIFIITF